MSDRYCVALQGFSAFERSALASFFRLAAQRLPGYAVVDSIAQADFVVADADHPGVIDAVLEAGRLADTVFVGAQAPEGASAWMLRPIDPMHVQRELDAMVALRHPQRALPTEARPGARGRTAIARAADQVVPARRAYEHVVAAAPALVDTEVLVVDDNVVALHSLSRAVERHGLHARSARSSGKALELMAQRPFAAVLLDVDLGDDSELDGLALCRRIKHAPPTGARAPVVVLVSTHGEPVDRVRGTLAGCDAYLTKPLDEALLLRTLEDFGVVAAVKG